MGKAHLIQGLIDIKKQENKQTKTGGIAMHYSDVLEIQFEKKPYIALYFTAF